MNELKAFLKALPALSDTNREKRLFKAKKSLFYFSRIYFPHVVGSGREYSKFRSFFYAHTDSLWQKKTLIEAYRGAAKTTLLRITLLYSLLCQNRHYGFWISSNSLLANESLEAIKIELSENDRLKFDFNVNVGDIWRGKEISFYIGSEAKKSGRQEVERK